MSNPVFDIEIGPTTTTSKVVVNGVDISSSLRGIVVECHVNGATSVSLRLTPGASRMKVHAALEAVEVK